MEMHGDRRIRKHAYMMLLSLVAFLMVGAVTASADPSLQVQGVFAPGNGGNYVKEGGEPAGTQSQRDMYDGLPKALDHLTEDELSNFFKPADFEVPAQDVASRISPRVGVEIVRDKTHNVPHVKGVTREDAMFGVGYARAQDRLWQMEEFRAQWWARSAEFLGRGENDMNLQSDARTFRLIDYSKEEYKAMFDRLEVAYGYWGKQAAKDIRAYVDGLNAYLDAIEADPSLLPLEYVHRNIKPQRWDVTDIMAMAAFNHISWGGGLGAGEEANAQLLAQLEAKFGDKAQSVYEDLRSKQNARTSVSLPAVQSVDLAVNPASIAKLDLGSYKPREILQVGQKKASLDLDLAMVPKVRSNALLVAAKHSVTGHPLAVQGPQDGYATPHNFDSEIAIVAPDFKARGILEISGPYPYVAGRGENYAWSITILPPDQADTFAEVLCEPDGKAATIQSTHYLYKGKCLPFTSRTESRQLADGGSYTLTSERSVHGPVIGRAMSGGKPVALAQARTYYMHEEMDYVAHAQLFSPSVIKSAADFGEVVTGTVYNIGWWYVDTKDIAGFDAGLVPVRAPGAARDLPVWGTGEWDWEGFDPSTYTFQTPSKSQYPHTINGPDGVIAGWNNATAVGWPMKDQYWSATSDHRVQLLKEPTLDAVAKGPISLTDLVKIHTKAAVTDFQAQQFYPLIRKFVGELPDKEVEESYKLADRWAAAGGLRLDSTGDGKLEHGPGIALLDRLWKPLVRSVFEPQLGSEILDGAGKTNNLPSLNIDPDTASPWLSRVADEIRFYSGQAPEPKHRYCGASAEECRKLLATELEKAYAATKKELGAMITDWQVPATCDKDCMQIEFTPTGDLPAVPPISWQNRGTYVQTTTTK